MKEIPKKYQIWMKMISEYNDVYYVVADKLRTSYILYKLDNKEYEKISESENPKDFDKIVFAKEKKEKKK